MLKKESQLDGLLEMDWKKIRVTAETSVDISLGHHLYLQTVASNARNGTSLFQRRRFPNVTIDDVVKALKLKTDKLKTERQRMINDFLTWVDNALSGVTRGRLVNENDEALFLITPLGKYTVNADSVIRGIYLWSSIQKKEIIRKTEAKYKKTIGHGSYYLVDMQQLAKNGINADDLEHFGHEDMIDFYREIKMITNQENVWREPEGKIKYLFIRHSLGAGISSDLAIVLAGIIYGRDAAFGVVLSQVLEAISIYTHQFIDYSADISGDIKRKFEKLDIDENELISFLNLVVMPDDENRDAVPSSSPLELFIVDAKTGVYPLEAYLAFIEQKPLVPAYIGASRILSLDFFRYVNKLLLAFKVLDTIPSGNYLKMSLNLPAADFASRDYIVIKADDPISKGINQMIQTRKDILIIVDNEGRLNGVLHSSDIVRLFER
jgi:CBS domain-containing protein